MQTQKPLEAASGLSVDAKLSKSQCKSPCAHLQNVRSSTSQLLQFTSQASAMALETKHYVKPSYKITRHFMIYLPIFNLRRHGRGEKKAQGHLMSHLNFVNPGYLTSENPGCQRCIMWKPKHTQLTHFLQWLEASCRLTSCPRLTFSSNCWI